MWKKWSGENSITVKIGQWYGKEDKDRGKGKESDWSRERKREEQSNPKTQQKTTKQ